MKKLVLVFTAFILSSAALFAQADELTMRKIWCGLDAVEAPNVREFKETCEKMVSVYPDPTVTAQFEIKRKLYLNKMRGVLKRGATWDKLTPDKRNDLAKYAIELTDEYLDIKKGDENPQPAEFQRGEFQDLEFCMNKKFEYSSVESCYADCEYVYRSCKVGPRGSSDIQAFWCVLEFLACQVDCDLD